ncbi:MAG: hypothetical protein WB615_03435 [Candidatus Tumulicola sp.]
MKLFTIATLIALVLLVGGAATATPKRLVVGNTIVSNSGPQVRVTMPKESVYIGTDDWTLYGITDCQVFVFVEADAAHRVQRLYWVQFEQYLASMPKLAYQYTSPRRARLGTKDFIVDDWTSTSATPSPPDYSGIEKFLASLGYPPPVNLRTGSDTQHVVALLAAKGFRLPTPRAAIRLVHLLDARKRGELMIIFAEPIATHTQIDWQLHESLLSDALAHLKIVFP